LIASHTVWHSMVGRGRFPRSWGCRHLRQRFRADQADRVSRLWPRTAPAPPPGCRWPGWPTALGWSASPGRC